MAAILFGLCLPVDGGAETLVFETAGPAWFNGPIHSTWIQITPDAFGPPDHALWGLSELEQALALFDTNPSDPLFLRSLSEDVSQINFADEAFNSAYSGTGWDVGAALVPLFSSGDGSIQDDWGARFYGAIHIQTAGRYNFGVLSDDGFALVLSVDGTDYKISHDGLNPRDRYGYPQDFFLTPGDYNFSLEAYDHLNAGVVSLGLWHDPPDLETDSPIVAAEPGGLGLLLIGVAGLGTVARKLRKLEL